MRRRHLLLALPLLLPALASATEPAEKAEAKKKQSPFVVHEWGTFTTIAGVDGASIDWRPLTGHADLPSFVYTRSRYPEGIRNQNRFQKSRVKTRVRMETPVIYFYTPVERKVSVRVGFPEGIITEWYPRARDVRKGIDWGTFLVKPGLSNPPLRREPGKSHYYPARNVDAAPIRVCSQGTLKNAYEYEKFLFYRGVGKFDAKLPIRAHVDGEDVVATVGNHTIAQVIRFEREGDTIRYSISCDVRGRCNRLPRGKPRPLSALLADLHKILVGQGLYAKEAQAMIDTWKDHWFTEGSRVFYVVPRAVTDAILPLKVTPKPDETVRVMVGRIELLPPARIKRIETLAWQLGSPDPLVRARARAALDEQGRFAEPILRRLLPKVKDADHAHTLKQLVDGR